MAQGDKFTEWPREKKCFTGKVPMLATSSIVGFAAGYSSVTSRLN